jgi:hypothetical protein
MKAKRKKDIEPFESPPSTKKTEKRRKYASGNTSTKESRSLAKARKREKKDHESEKVISASCWVEWSYAGIHCGG